MTGISNTFLDQVATFMSPKTFIGVYPCDFLRFLQPKPTYIRTTLACNLALSHVVDGHFIMISISWIESTVYVFCPLCLAFSDPNVTRFLSRFLLEHPGFKIKSSPFVIQSRTSDFCALFCLAFLASQSSNESFESFYNRFYPSELEKNDQISLNYVLTFIVNKGNEV